MTPLQPAHFELSSYDTPYSAAYDDVYHSALGGPAQARQVFIAGNQLPQRWQGRDRFVILETGFGTGLNFLATWQAWRDDPQRCRRLHFVSFEKHPFRLDDLATIHHSWHEFADLADQLRRHWPALVPGTHRIHLDGDQVTLTLIFGDAAQQIRAVDASVDAFFLDGFSPPKNPEMWSPEFCKGLSRLAAPGATLATWSVAGQVRQALSDAEFEVRKQTGFTGKRQMLVGHLRSRRPDRYPCPTDRRAIVIGAGIAGSTTAHRLAAAGWQVTVLESRASPGDGASGNIAGMLRPLPSADDNRLSRLTRAGYLATRALLAQLPDARWSPCGVLHLGRESEHEAVQRRTVEALGFPAEVIQFIERDAASEKLGWPVDTGGWWFPGGGWVQPPSLCAAALAAFPERIMLRCNAAVDRLNRTESTWQALAEDGEILAEAPTLVMASGVAAPRFSQFSWLPQVSARGQVSHLPAGTTPGLDVVLTKLGYAMPEVDGVQLAGATLSYDDEFNDERPTDHQENLARLNLMLPGFAAGIDPATLHGRVGFRPMSPDRMPIVGPVPLPVAAGSNTRLHNLARHPGLWCVQGFGARGIVWSALMADLLVSQIEGAPLPLENDLVNAVDPGRFLIRPARRNVAE
ncbi:bifunctional tRNA (5-methylaminomethyl-2-thiouridine)(34)-methyltransferase MnmD/FAD-dependent 5-carboxymethylaminomethyl-2-thiouridine(34) oxidoreductase MnmC [Dechloromonas denitrificans]|uniref:bifunctional tRNA (5-methylaminomethyl-2-thiouridine)(34)-methyltransferase MnmD/FAD-dependent 5-carboxymethylaminomethyl-2-thiouridine(34) oxidoreductase MnmC n=1 Tax=Dechloromonas denitrificans TaxID=281362 RepID=UPI001CF8C3BF|nr:bifunctional tRNA (5-methylaminomethyl-2-thiouridine)(34)-methyltransferase MnmD/FAD-dependent 5-carboxymethylaminomethyl-2-thiouridine(34) oxidoreductase MnmC [Dechloromonas denitrificans]UCV12855.1 bifunctional tRNA (5-methylaminomethyl-2-thiouridine)(34)-methyltransferase MnmD/FAD-dependent 5-carboxymethylaminomethyl-2-thiouridine(34) oxidoreductase MnmC [Dechloromonas denitrificans]